MVEPMRILLSILALFNPSEHIPREQVLCLAKNIYWEARGSELMDQIRVSTVTMNRVADSGKSVCEVVYEPYQFSWTNGGEPPLVLHNSIEEEAWKQAVEIAALKITGNDLGDTSDAKWFYSPKLASPSWALNKIVVASSEDFVFMSAR